LAQFFFKFDNNVFKARLPQEGEQLKHPLKWDGLEFEMTKNSIFMMAWTSLIPDLMPEQAKALVKLGGARYPTSPEYESLRKLCPEIVVGFDAPEWVFFGGTFHPWHAGHQACLNLLPDDKTCFVLPDRNPLKEFRDLDPVTTIIELSSRIKFKHNHYLVPTFLLDNKKNPTIEWIERLRKDYPEKKLSLLMGFDSLMNIPHWTRYQDLLKNLDTVYVASRMEQEETREEYAAPLLKLAPLLKIVFLGRHEHEHLSSTELRKKK
jgi:nicotinic acid mononucleotide adenylyltransferase